MYNVLLIRRDGRIIYFESRTISAVVSQTSNLPPNELGEIPMINYDLIGVDLQGQIAVAFERR